VPASRTGRCGTQATRSRPARCGREIEVEPVRHRAAPPVDPQAAQPEQLPEGGPTAPPVRPTR
jgi:hypothetical protein